MKYDHIKPRVYNGLKCSKPKDAAISKDKNAVRNKISKSNPPLNRSNKQIQSKEPSKAKFEKESKKRQSKTPDLSKANNHHEGSFNDLLNIGNVQNAVNHDLIPSKIIEDEANFYSYSNFSPAK